MYADTSETNGVVVGLLLPHRPLLVGPLAIRKQMPNCNAVVFNSVGFSKREKQLDESCIGQFVKERAELEPV